MRPVGRNLENEMAIITGKLRDVWMNAGEPVLVIERPRVGSTVLREHLNVRQRDLAKSASVGSLRIGDMVAIKGNQSLYVHNGAQKVCMTEITSIKKI